MHKFLALLAVAGVVSAQSFDGLPPCAITCVGSSLPANCGVDPACICKSSGFINGISCCVSTACNAADQEATLEYARGICQPAGVTNLPTAAGCTSGASSGTASVTPTGSIPSSSRPAPTSSGGSIAQSASSAVSSVQSSLSSAGASLSSQAESATSAASESAAAATSEAAGDNAGGKLVAQWGAVGAGVLGVAAML